VPDDFVQRAPPRLGDASTAELVTTLAHPNGWHRETAARLLFERQDPSAAPIIEKLLRESASSLGRLHALYALHGQNALREEHILLGLGDDDAHVRVHAIKLAEQIAPTPAILDKLATLAADDASMVRYQLAFALGQVEHPRKPELLAAIARRDIKSEWMRAAVASSLADGAADAFRLLAREGGDDVEPLLAQLADMIGAKHDEREVQMVLEVIRNTRSAAKRFTLATHLAQGHSRRPKAGASLREELSELFAEARSVITNPLGAHSDRLPAITLIGFAGDEASNAVLLVALKQRLPSLQLATLAALDRADAPDLTKAVLDAWETLSPRARNEAVAVLLKRPQRALHLLDAIDRGYIAANVLDSSQVTMLHSHTDAAVRKRAAEVIAPIADRTAVIESFRSALDLEGNASRGRAIYAERCISCHRAAGEGFAVGPDIESFRNNGRDQLLASILDPNREVAPSYVAYIIDTTDGENLLGLITADTPTNITILQPYARETTLARSRIKSMSSRGKSLMPEGLEADLSPQQLADLLEFIKTLGD
jgi:putative heme-binding domain-containing protein